jgi:hypothetical protein
MAIRMQQRRGTAAQWTAANPTLAAGEIGFETDTGKFKIGNGASVWSALSYFADAEDFDTATIEATIDSKVATAVSNLVDGSPETLNTLNEIADAINNDSSFAASVVSSLATKANISDFTAHTSNTTDVHGIVNTADLVVQSVLTAAISAHDVTTNVHGIVDTSVLATTTGVTEVVDLHDGTTTNVHGIANTADLATQTNLSDAISLHNSETTDVHGIADTTALATQTYANDQVSTHNNLTANVHGIADTSVLATTTTVNDAVGAHNIDTTNVHGIADTADLVLTNDARLSDERTPLDGSVTDAKINGTLSQSSITNLTTDLAAKAPLESPALTGTPTAPTANAGDNSTKVATTAYVDSAVTALVDSAPGALNTLNELAAALGDDANFSTTVTNSLALKLEQSDLNEALYYEFNSQASSYTLALSDSTNMVEVNSASGVTITVPPNASVAFPVGSYIDIFQKGAGQVTIAEGSGVTIYATPGKKLRTQYSNATLIKRDTNVWILAGDIVA